MEEDGTSNVAGPRTRSLSEISSSSSSSCESTHSSMTGAIVALEIAASKVPDPGTLMEVDGEQHLPGGDAAGADTADASLDSVPVQVLDLPVMDRLQRES